MFEYNGSRIAFSLFGIDVYWYGLLIVSGMVLAIALIANELKKQEQDPDLIYDLSLWVIPAAIIGARLWYVIFEFDRYDSILEMINVRDGGLAIQGGIIAGVISGYIFSKRKKLNFIKLADIIFVFLPLAQAIGRWGNFINNEAYGYETNLPWAVIIDGKSYHPTFFYESLSNFILSMVLWYLYRNIKLKDGTTTSWYLIFYGIIRFFVEGLRTDSLYWGPIRVAQLISIVFILLGIVLLVYMNSKKKKDYRNITKN